MNDHPSSFSGETAFTLGLIRRAERAEDRVKVLEATLQQFANCDLNEQNCASLEVATRRIQMLARKALGWS